MEINLFDPFLIFFAFVVLVCSLTYKNKDKKWLIMEDPTLEKYNRNSKRYEKLVEIHNRLARERLLRPHTANLTDDKMKRVTKLLKDYDKAAQIQYQRLQH